MDHEPQNHITLKIDHKDAWEWDESMSQWVNEWKLKY